MNRRARTVSELASVPQSTDAYHGRGGLYVRTPQGRVRMPPPQPDGDAPPMPITETVNTATEQEQPQ
jgi:hypothetical protein